MVGTFLAWAFFSSGRPLASSGPLNRPEGMTPGPLEVASSLAVLSMSMTTACSGRGGGWDGQPVVSKQI